MYLDVDHRLRAIFFDVLQVEFGPQDDNLPLQQIETWDSINHLQLILELEHEFGISISDEEALNLCSLGDAKALLAERSVRAA